VECWHRLCCNPEHLRAATRGQNLRDGNGNGGAKWTPKTECVNGHDLTDPSNLMKRTDSAGGRSRCRSCVRELSARRRKA
jgi:hypothetical protein